MKSVKYASFVVALVLLAGCATTFRPWKLSEVEEGMDRSQVVEVLGEPDSMEMKDGVEYLYYSYSENYSPPQTADSVKAYDAERSLRKAEYAHLGKEYRYAVKMVDGKVQTYKELTD